MALFCFVVVRKSTVKGILSRREFCRDVIAAMSTIRVVNATVVFGPFLVPRACPIRDRIVTSRFLADPKDGSHDFLLPRETLSRLRRIFGQLTRRACERSNVERTAVF